MALSFVSSRQPLAIGRSRPKLQTCPRRNRAQPQIPCMTTTSPQQTVQDFLASPSTEHDIENLQTWCTNNGIQYPLLTISPTSRALIVQSPITPPTSTIAVPRSAALIVDITSPSPPTLQVLSGVSIAFWRNASWEIRLAVRLLDEVACGASSRYLAYICALPRNPGGMLWAYQQAGRTAVTRQLQRYGMQPVADAYRASIKSQFVAFRAGLPPGQRDVVDLRAFSWAVGIAQSRGFGIPTGDDASAAGMAGCRGVPLEYALFPGLDMGNHSVHCKTNFVFDESRDEYCVIAGSGFEIGEQFLLSYGPKSNDDLVFFYGFVEGNNPANVVKIVDTREWLLDVCHRNGSEDEDWERKLQILKEKRMTLVEKVYELRQDGLDDGLVQALRIVCATLEEIDEIGSRKNGTDVAHALSLENELKVWKCIECKCDQLLDELGDFSQEEQERLTQMYEKKRVSAVWTWGLDDGDGQLLYRYERQMVLSATKERVCHFAKVSAAVGRICTVLLPPSQSMLRTDIFGKGVSPDDTSGVHKFAI